MPVKEEKDSNLRESPLPPRGAASLYNRNATDSHSSHGSDDGREEYNRKMMGFDKRELASQPTIPTVKSNVKKKKEEKEGSDHEKSDGELVVDDQNDVCYIFISA